MVTHEQAEVIKEYLDVYQMHFFDGTRLAKLEEVNRSVKAGTPRYPEIMAMMGLDSDKDKQTSEEIVKREMQLAKERRLLYFDEIKAIHNQLSDMGIDERVKRIQESLHLKVIVNHKDNIMTEDAMGMSEAGTLMSIIRDKL
ncbi:hypothetical protein GO009_05990 [Muricauda sp. TY007]|uniref:hypothetical protein n=1 Tax=Allomuricauda sp. TY007 TaxID=2683200 RepID=UPI0013C059CD|nr:hypothetical protein [Muricauda sp. TY007]NDV15572.1 hypothetical protein [Muricauda sp. TY007]